MSFSHRRNEIKTILLQARKLFAHAGFEKPDEVDVNRLIEQLEEPFAVFVCGEFNSGKSSLINALSKKQQADTGVIPTTSQLSIYESAELGDILLIDSPGTNSLFDEHEERTRQFLQKSDILLFVTSAERPVTRSESEFIKLATSEWQREIIVAINKIDLLEDTERREVQQWVRDSISTLLNKKQTVYLVSANTKEGIDELLLAMRTELGSKKREDLKLAGPLAGLKKGLDSFGRLLNERRKHLNLQVEQAEGLLARAERRLAGGKIYIQSCEDKTKIIFSDLKNRLYKIVGESFGFFNLIKSHLGGKDSFLKERVQSEIADMNLQSRIDEMLESLARGISEYHLLVIEEIREDLGALREGTKELLKIDINLNSVQLADDLKKRSEMAIKESFLYGSAAAAAGIGSQIISTAAMFEISALIVTVVLALFSYKSVSRQRKKAFEKISDTFDEFCTVVVDAVREKVSQMSSEVSNSIKECLKPDLESAKENLKSIESWEKEASVLRKLSLGGKVLGNGS